MLHRRPPLVPTRRSTDLAPRAAPAARALHRGVPATQPGTPELHHRHPRRDRRDDGRRRARRRAAARHADAGGTGGVRVSFSSPLAGKRVHYTAIALPLTVTPDKRASRERDPGPIDRKST